MLVNILRLSWFLLAVAFLVGITNQQDKKIVKALIYSRISYLVVLSLEVILTIRCFTTQPVLATVNFLLVICTISFVDIAYQRKIQGTGDRIIPIITIMLMIASWGWLLLLH
ncbi:hypothetical protein B808_888 [Fructilactobacillus florum 8D]|uniref:DUF1516 family protein n=2 Tax=Fructilactobacillus florum TaxID=640331 RepID=W9EFR9_9LACO|nr:DUF1516 family protein [Fructilactobacillus florum]EKK20656.1 hypothetical protein B807_497 [Fructilactobacillus florum 2F]ETO40121.1 hypothetical protein B808_888 [Fructilactobacillus florum 8D]KRM91860.1 hypothetical protein FC87_GL000685 [Fructilactobacillus florum DSM 22689 = JCM 16035]